MSDLILYSLAILGAFIFWGIFITTLEQWGPWVIKKGIELWIKICKP